MHILKDSFSQISFIAKHKQLYLKWVSEPGEDDLLRVYTKALDFAKSLQAHSMIVDNSIGFTVTIAMQRSLVSLAINQLPLVQIRKFARVTPPDIFQEIITHKVLDQINLLAKKPIEVAYFQSLEAALAWTSLLPSYEETATGEQP